MDPLAYRQHIRRVLLNEAMAKIDAMTDADVVNTAFLRAREIDPTLKRSAFEGALKEGMNPEEINSILGLEMHDPINEMTEVPEMDSAELEDTIVESLNETFALFIDKPGATVLMEYCYFDEDEDGNPINECRGNMIAYGEKQTIDALLKDMKGKVADFTSNGFVDSSSMLDDDDEDDEA